MSIYQYCLIILTFLTLTVAYLARALNAPASLLAFAMVAVAMTAGNGYALFLLLAFILISVVDRVCKKKTAFVDNNYTQRSGTRDAVQVFANGGIAMASVLLRHATGDPIFLYCFVASLIESFGDSAASAIGVAFDRQTYDICGFHKMAPGLSGGVSVAGTLGCAASCLAMALLALVLGLAGSIGEVLLLALAAFLGCVVDSLLGSTAQRKQQCPLCGLITEKAFHCGIETVYHSGVRWINNDAVNFICNYVSAALAWLLFRIAH